MNLSKLVESLSLYVDLIENDGYTNITLTEVEFISTMNEVKLYNTSATKTGLSTRYVYREKKEQNA